MSLSPLDLLRIVTTNSDNFVNIVSMLSQTMVSDMALRCLKIIELVLEAEKMEF